MTTDRCSHGELMTDSCAACDGYTKAEAVASASVPAGGTPGGLAREKVDEQRAAVNPADRPATEPRTADDVLNEDYTYIEPKFAHAFREGWKAHEAEAAQGAAPEPHRDYAGRTCTTGLLHDHSEGAAPRAEGLDEAVSDLLRTCRGILAPQGYSGVTQRIDRILYRPPPFVHQGECSCIGHCVEGVDVLAEAMWESLSDQGHLAIFADSPEEVIEYAEAVLARLSRPSDERVPGEEATDG